MVVVLVIRVALIFANPPAIDAALVREAIAEAAAIWAPYGLVLERIDACVTRGSAVPALTVEVAGSIATRPPVVLGTIPFDAGGAPEPGVTLFAAEVMRFVAGARVMGLDASQWSRPLRDLIVGRALGRVLAHEIGHYVLANRRHTETGLMRASQRADDLAAFARAGFALSQAEAAQLRALSVEDAPLARTSERAGTCGRP